ncbi:MULTISPECIES: hypothetical protein [Trichocoleus]|uniref:Uncharacterized protein n=1 Tax=Trichocoleus desertorum GB2-A4 TaxID=2933944 RepID=A0ABV0JGY7_9CYAN|nr:MULTISPECIES: hypothetical protein [unclassified Trichocoleus]
MSNEFSWSMERKELLFRAELIHRAIPEGRAAQVAKLLAADTPDELLTAEEQQLVDEVCRLWLKRRSQGRLIGLSSVL